ncbi:MAG: immunoglobulin domain-containing protein [Verrucomicrobiae bacterium]|nr:immunoglobulin domain-containing protein [Verrucomicrobiae bacterium]
MVGIAAGGRHSLALRADGTVVAWGWNEYGQANVAPGLADVVAVAAGAQHSMALRSDGSVVVWGGITNVPADVSNVVAIAAGYYHCLALKADGSVVVWDSSGLRSVPAELSNVSAISGGYFHNLAIVDAGPVQIIQNPQSQEVPRGSTVTFTVTATGYEPLSYQWYCDGRAITNSDRISGATNATLTITDARLGDIGSYSVVVANPLGAAASRAAALVVASPPVITLHPVGRDVRAGSDVSFKVGAEGTPPLGFYLLLNRTQVVAATSSTWPSATITFSLTNVQPAQSGIYSVLVSNAYGGVFSSNALLTVTDSPPYISVQPTNQTVFAYTVVTMPVVARGSEPLRYQWRFNGADSPGATNATLTITNARPFHTGYYNVLVSNLFGLTNSAKVYLYVTEVAAWPIYYNPQPATNVPAGLSNVIALGAGRYHVLALKNDGTVVTWPAYLYPPTGLTNIPAHATNVVAIAAGGDSSMALRADGRVVVWGISSLTNVPSAASNVVAIATSGNHCLAVRRDGTVIGWGGNTSGEATPPPGLSNVIAVAAGPSHSVALKADGTVVAWGQSAYRRDQCATRPVECYCHLGRGHIQCRITRRRHGCGLGLRLQLSPARSIEHCCDCSLRRPDAGANSRRYLSRQQANSSAATSRIVKRGRDRCWRV